jgi:hypothetical protein
MGVILASIVVALACVVASARRMFFATHATVLHPDDVVAALDRAGPDFLDRLRAAVEKIPDAEWERDLLEALASPRPEVRVALVNEQLTELDYRLQRWARVPRVCASVATSVGILLGTLVLRRGIADADDFGEAVVLELIGDALGVVACGLAGTAFCIGAHAYARRTTRVTLEAADKMIERLEAEAGKMLSGPGDPR